MPAACSRVPLAAHLSACWIFHTTSVCHTAALDCSMATSFMLCMQWQAHILSRFQAAGSAEVMSDARALRLRTLNLDPRRADILPNHSSVFVACSPCQHGRAIFYNAGELRRWLDYCCRMAAEELGKGQYCNDKRVAQYQGQADIHVAQVKQASGEVQYHKVCAVNHHMLSGWISSSACTLVSLSPGLSSTQLLPLQDVLLTVKVLLMQALLRSCPHGSGSSNSCRISCW